MNEVVIPTCGRTVHYFTQDDADAALIQSEVTAATVVQANGLNCNLSVFTQNQAMPLLVRSLVPHKSEVPPDVKTSYWDWPPRS